MSDGRIIIDTKIDTSEVEKGTEKIKKSFNDTKIEINNSNKETEKLEKQFKKLREVLGGEVPEATKEAYINIQRFNREIQSTSRQFGTNSLEAVKARNALNEYVLGLDDTTFKQIYMRSQLGLTDAQLNQQANSIKLNARMVKLMGSQTEMLTKRMQGLKEHGVKPKDLLPASTIGQFQMLNETIKASENPIYKLSVGYRTFGTAMEKTIKGWSAQKMAVKLAGDDMVKYGLLLRGITAGQTNLAMALPIVGITAALVYNKIFSSAIQANEGLQKLAETAKGKLTQAFKPLLDVAGKFLEVVFKVVIKVADMMIKFNDMHPIISKVVATISLLAPAFTLLLLPLNMGIGLLNGWKVAINSAWVAIGGIASAIGIATSTFLVFAAIIGTVVGGLIYFYKTNETFRNTVNKAWESISQKSREVFGGLAKYFTETLPNAFKQGGFEGLATTIGNSISAIVKMVYAKAPQLLKSGVDLIKNFITGVQNNLPQILATGSQIITNIIQGISTALPLIVAKMNETRMVILNAIASNLPQILETGVQIITMLIQGVAQALPVLMGIGVQIITFIINTITENLPTIISIGITLLTTLLNGIIQSLPVLIDAGIQILMALVNAITQNLPIIIQATIQIITTLIDAITQNLPMILEAGIQVLIALINGLVQALPQLIEAIPKIFNALVEGFMSADWGGLGSQILAKIIDILSPLTQFIMDFFNNTGSFFTQTIPLWIDNITYWFQSLPEKISVVFNSVLQRIIDWGINISNYFTTNIPIWIDSIFNWFNELPYKIGYALGFVLGTIIKWGVDTFNYLVTNVPIWIESISTWFSELPGKIWTWLVNAFNMIVQWGTDTYNNATTWVCNTINSVVSWFSQLPSRIWTWLSNVISNIRQWGSNVYTTATNYISNTVNSIINWFSQLPGRISTWLSNVISSVARWGSNMVSQGVQAASNLVSSIANTVSSLPGKMADIGSNIVRGVWNGITGMGGWIREKVNSFFSGIVDGAKAALGIHSPSRVFRDQVGKYMAQGVGIGFEDETQNIQKDMQGNLSELTAKMQATVDYETTRTTTKVVAQNKQKVSNQTENSDSGIPEGSVFILKNELDGKVIGESAYEVVNRKLVMASKRVR